VQSGRTGVDALDFSAFNVDPRSSVAFDEFAHAQ